MTFRILYIALFATAIVSAQSTKKDTLDTEVINVVKPYNPSVSDAFKITRNPRLDQDTIVKPSNFQYHIFSVPVASTFTPTRGAYVGIKPQKLRTIYDNFFSASYGNFNTPQIETFMHSSSKTDDIGAFLNYKSSGGGVKNALLDDAYSDIKLDAYYKTSKAKYDWNVNTGVRFQNYNWYGLSPFITSPSATLLSSINPKQTYKNFYAGSSMTYYDAVFQGGTFEYNYISDYYKTSENQVYLAPVFAFPISTEFLTATFSLNYIDGKFDSGYTDINPITYQFLTFGFQPNLEVNRQYFSFNLGLRLYYSEASKTPQESKFYAYPNITASYKLDGGQTLFGGVIGDLNQNSYSAFAKENPYVSPTLNIRRTDQQYKAFLGFKGLTKGVTYHIKASYQSEKDKPLFVLNPVKVIDTNNRAYEFGNSFDVVYDDVNTLSIEGQLELTLSEQLQVGGLFQYNSYTLSSQQEAWNLPQLKADLFAKYTYNKWFAKAKIFVNGQRKGQQSHLFPMFSTSSPQVVDLKAYADVNLSGGYNFSDRFSAFVQLENILNNNYQRFTNYDVLGFQALAGLTYKFDF